MQVDGNTRQSLAANVIEESYSMRAEDIPMSDPESFYVSVSFLVLTNWKKVLWKTLSL